jgi:hypothetical protein
VPFEADRTGAIDRLYQARLTARPDRTKIGRVVNSLADADDPANYDTWTREQLLEMRGYPQASNGSVATAVVEPDRGPEVASVACSECGEPVAWRSGSGRGRRTPTCSEQCRRERKLRRAREWRAARQGLEPVKLPPRAGDIASALADIGPSVSPAQAGNPFALLAIISELAEQLPTGWACEVSRTGARLTWEVR